MPAPPPFPPEVLRFGTVLEPPREVAARLGERLGRLTGPLPSRTLAYARKASELRDRKSWAEAIALYSDLMLLQGDLDAAFKPVNDALMRTQPIELVRRDAVIRALRGAADAPQRLEAVSHARSLPDRVVAALMRTWLDPRPVALHGIPELLAALRAERAYAMLCRAALIAAAAYARGGQGDLALLEILRSKAQASRARDRDLARNTELAMKALVGHGGRGGVDMLVRLSLDLGKERETRAVFDRIARSTLELVDAERAFVLRGEPESLEVVASAYRPGESGRPSLSIAKHTATQGRELITTDVGDLVSGAAESVQAMRLRMVLCIPMSDGVRVQGVIYADSKRANAKELESAAWLVRAFAAHAVLAMRNTERLMTSELATRRGREVVHDVRNLASGMRLGLEELDDLDLPPWAQRTLADLTSMNRLLLDTVKPLLDQTRLARQRVALHSLVERAASLVRFDAKAAGVEIEVSTVPVEVYGIDQELARVAANLLNNALKYSPAGGRVTIALAVEGEHALLTVRDQGPGVPPEALETVFDSGTQALGAKHGYGLGLGICSHFVRQHEGDIRVHNDPAGGAVFEVRLPRL